MCTCSPSLLPAHLYLGEYHHETNSSESALNPESSEASISNNLLHPPPVQGADCLVQDARGFHRGKGPAGSVHPVRADRPARAEVRTTRVAHGSRATSKCGLAPFIKPDMLEKRTKRRSGHSSTSDPAWPEGGGDAAASQSRPFPGLPCRRQFECVVIFSYTRSDTPFQSIAGNSSDSRPPP